MRTRIDKYELQYNKVKPKGIFFAIAHTGVRVQFGFCDADREISVDGITFKITLQGKIVRCTASRNRKTVSVYTIVNESL